MKKLVYGFIALVTVIFIFSSVTLKAQVLTPIKTWDFETSLDNWRSGNEGSAYELSTEKAVSGTQSVKLVKPASGLEINLQNDVYKDFMEGDVISVKVWISAADAALVNGFQIFWQTGSWSWNSIWVNGSNLTGDAWTTIERTFTAVATPINRLGFQLLLKSGNESATPTLFVDDIVISRYIDPTLVNQWGSIQRHGWPIVPGTEPGNAGMGSDTYPQGAWATLRGGFEPLTADVAQAVVATGKLELLDGGATSWSALRYGIFHHDSAGTVINAGTDSARWSGPENFAYGYMFSPRSGVNDQVSGQGGNGSLWAVNGGSWISTWSGGTMTMGVFDQAPLRAEMTAGVYNWAFSVRPVGDGTTEVKWYLVKEDNSYWFGGTAIDTTGEKASFNGVLFGINSGNGIENTGITGLNIYEARADLGDPVEVPEAPWEPFYVKRWGINEGATAWPILNDSTYLDGDASLGDGAIPTNWTSIRGGFEIPVTATTSKAIIVKGQLELVGGGCDNAYTHLRYALTYQDSTTLNYQYTDSAIWVSPSNHYGYGFHPRTGTGTMSNGAGGVGTVWTINGGRGWNSTWSNNGGPISAVKQAPRNAEMIEGLYNWAISVQPLGDGTNEIRWYMVEQNNKYWYGGTIIDVAGISTKFNSVLFGFNKDILATQINLYEVMVDMGDPIVVPIAPWEPFYVNQWGINEGATAWPILNDSTYLDGDASLGDGAIPTNWTSIRGGFGDPVEATTDRAIIVKGQLELVGGGCDNAYTHLRYALTYQDSTTLNYQYTDSAIWVSPSNHYGYGFHPRTGSGTMSNGAGGVGTVWTVNGGRGWNSTWSNNGGPISAVKQAPRNAEMIEGLYNWAISVQPLGDGTNEIRWYMIEKNNKYWYGGTVIDTAEVSTKFNSVLFGFNKDILATQINLYEVMVDMGDPIEVPIAPWEPFYVNLWGINEGATAWPILNDSTYLDGDASLGDGAIPTNWTSIRGGFGDPVEATTDRAIIVKGQLELVGGGCDNAYTHLRYALTYQDSTTLNYQYTDSAIWVSPSNHYGYGFHPRTGLGTMSNGAGGVGTVWTVNGGRGWNSTWSNNGGPISAVQQAPRNAEMIEGLYNWAISVQPLGDGTNEIRWYMIEKDTKYWYGGTVIDVAGISTKFNSVLFGFNKDILATQINLYEVMVDMGDPIEVPEAPWEAYYVTEWGFSGGNLGGWELTLGEFEGDVSIGGLTAPTGWSAVRGGIEPYVLSSEEDRALIVTGKIELVGGGFEDLASLRYGLFYSDSAGSVVQDPALDSAWVWNGTDEAHYGYLFVPPSGSNVATWSGTAGTWGAINDEAWWNIDGTNSTALGELLQAPANAVAGPGIYDFAISISPNSTGNIVKTTLTKTDGSYYFEVGSAVPVVATTNKINSIAFAINNSTTTTLNLIEVLIDRGPHIITDVNENEVEQKQIPTVYSLRQNYPNPFNPTTTVEFTLPRESEVKLVVYDLSGRVVAELAAGKFNAGYHNINFDAAELASGVYLIHLKAGDYVDVKKAMLLK